MDAHRRDRFEEVFRAHHATVRAYALRRADPATAEDAVAETFLVAWRRCDDLPADAMPWLLAVARRMLANQHRGRTRRERLDARLRGATPAWAPPPGEPGGGRDALHALARMRPADREVLMLVAWDDLGAERAAAVLGCTRVAFAQRLHRARQRFAAALEAQRAGEPPTPIRACEVTHEH